MTNNITSRNVKMMMAAVAATLTSYHCGYDAQDCLDGAFCRWDKSCIEGLLYVQADRGRKENSDIQFYNFAKATSRPVFEDNSQIRLHPAWAPDGRHIAFSVPARVPLDEAVSHIRVEEIFQDHSEQEPPLVQAEAYTHIQPSWSPDGTSIAFASKRWGEYNIYTINISGETGRCLTCILDGQFQMPVWGPDGKIFAVRSTDNDNDGFSNYSIVEIAADGSRSYRDLTTVENFLSATNPTWHPEKGLFFVGQPNTENAEREIYHCFDYKNGCDGETNSRALGYANFAPVEPTVSPDGKSIVFSHIKETESAQLRYELLRVDNFSSPGRRSSAMVLQIPEQYDAFNPAWSPCNRKEDE